MSRRSDPVQGAAAGILAGLVAGFVMAEFQKAWVAKDAPGAPDSNATPATTKLADKASRRFLGRPLRGEEREAADPFVHYATAAGLGALYGILAEDAPGITTGAGTLYGTVTAIGLDDGLVPLLGLSEGPESTPRETHLYSFASHWVFGAVLEGARRVLRLI